MKKYAKIIDEKTKACDVGLGTNTEYYESIGMSEMDVEQAYTGNWYVGGYAPEESIEEKNEQIRSERQRRYEAESDPIRLDYDEALAREQDNAEELKQEWLASKTKIRNELPYIVGDNDPEYDVLVEGQ